MKSLTRSELDGLLGVAKSHSQADYWLLLVMWNHGLRVSEVLALTAANFAEGKLVVQRLKGSRKTSQPLLLLESEETREDFIHFAANAAGRLFPTYRKAVQRMMITYGILAGIDRSKCHPHALKHTCGRLAYESGVGIPEIQKHLGHVNGKNTLVYMEATEEQASRAFAAAMGR